MVLPGVAYHLTHRGNNRQDIFRTDHDRRSYLQLLARYARPHRLRLLGYCLMSNHVHLVAVPEKPDSLAKAIGYAHQRYAQLANLRHNRSGHLWEGRFYSCPLDEAHLVTALRYVEQNPLRAGVAQVAEDYPWSSAPAHVGGPDPSGLLDLAAWRAEWPVEAWRDMLATPQDEATLEVLRRRTSSGRPLGSEAFLTRIEQFIGRALRPLRPGRKPYEKPRKSTS